ncbi:tumor necrosis factor receptor superfamily member 16-like [Paramuricea clavata]|uniref:Tumor necrosis factor receptor superfamily member 16-like n=1 Tax=Paramuricea clavata TaxID=317549 RepID=A0A6S7FSG6_PARCT|nr:tumor necrosis factor receptor superfamily member 16-like [Paramuricea clavata]
MMALFHYCVIGRIVSLLLSVNFIHLVWGGQQLCPNATVTDCNLKHHQVLVTENNCSRCICSKGYYQNHALGGCNTCRLCKYPFVIRKNCTHSSNTECAKCKKTYYHTTSGCRKCKKCEHGVLEACEKTRDTICAPKVTTSTTGTEKPTVSVILTNGNQADNGTGKDWECNPIWYYVSIVEFVIILIVILVCLVCCKYRRRLYTRTHTDASSLATSSSSLLLPIKSKCPDITVLTDQEREKLIRDLPGGYVDLLGQLLNPNVRNNWVQLGYEFRLTLSDIANRSVCDADHTQELLLYLGTRNTTVNMLWRGLKNIKRDDACGTLVNFILNLRKDNESAITYISVR